MKNLKFLVALFVLLAMAPLAIGQDGEAIDFGSANSVITWLMPVITLGATWLIKKIMPKVTGTVTLIVVPLVSTAIAYLGTLVTDDSSFLINLLAGLGSVFLNQLYRALTDNS